MTQNSKRTPASASLHDSILRTLATDMEHRGYVVYADHIGWPHIPRMVNGHVPDLVAESPTQGRFIMEVETCDTYGDDLTREQVAAFARVAGYQCYLVIPSRCEKYGMNIDAKIDAESLLRQWNLTGVKVATYADNTISY